MDALVTTAWLANHLDDPNVRIVDTRWYLLDPHKGEREYHAAHIPNAIYLHVDRHLAASPRADAKTGRHPLPSVQSFAETMAAAGISNSTHVVAYDDAGGANAARVWWLLRYFSGGDVPTAHVSLLDGGWNQWLAEGRAVSTDIPSFPRGTFHAQVNPTLLADKAEVERLTHIRNALILDARAPERYRGETEPVDARAGHIPGARNAPLSGNLRGADDSRFKDASELRARFDALGANGVDEIVAYCGSGINAAADLFALHLAGYDNTRLYAASFSEWSRDPDLPVITGGEPYQMRGRVVLRDAARNEWLHFENPREIVTAHTLSEVLPALERAEAWANEGGYAAGFIAYEAAPALDSALETHALPDVPLVWFGLYDAPSNHPTTQSPNHLTTQPPNHLATEPPNHLSTQPPRRPLPPHPTTWLSNVSRTTYDAAIACIRDHIARGDTYQVNYTLRLNAHVDEDAWLLFQRLVRAQPNSYAAFMDTGRHVIASASPELFLRREGEHLTMQPMKGTAPRGRFLQEDQERGAWLQHSEKNRAENVMIVDMTRNDLGRVARVGSVTVPHLWQTECYPTVWQMTSTVTAESDTSFVEILRATFPAASITGAPKRRTMQLIATLETEPRGVYTGAIGYLAPNRRAQFNVAIRTAVVDRQTNCAQYGVGGGIVWDSTAGDEYLEVQHKARVLTEPALDFSLIESLRWTPTEGFWLLDYHLRRLRDSAEYFDYPFDEPRVLGELQRGVSSLPPTTHKVRLLLARDGELTFSPAPMQPMRELTQLALAQTPVNSNDKFLFHKTTQREVYEAALAQRGTADDVLLWNERGELTETCSSNIVLQFGDEYFTPPIECGLLGGTLRASLLDKGKIRERVLRLQDLERADALYRINSVRGWLRATLDPTAKALAQT